MLINKVENILMRRPFWMNVVFLFCVYMTFVYLPWDVFIKPIAEDEEVWFGFLFYGWMAKLGGIVHWIVYGSLTYGLWYMRPWARPCVGLYLLQVAWSMIVWALLTDYSNSAWPSLAVASVFVILSILIFRNRSVFDSELS
jgi:hypothetical protein|tara:strand:+ start:1836 stop:2258 length:423 start_codon:yes stop_codon:yes gene_type:complete